MLVSISSYRVPLKALKTHFLNYNERWGDVNKLSATVWTVLKLSSFLCTITILLHDSTARSVCFPWHRLTPSTTDSSCLYKMKLLGGFIVPFSLYSTWDEEASQPTSLTLALILTMSFQHLLSVTDKLLHTVYTASIKTKYNKLFWFLNTNFNVIQMSSW